MAKSDGIDGIASAFISRTDLFSDEVLFAEAKRRMEMRAQARVTRSGM
jgi:hypothetical protein